MGQLERYGLYVLVVVIFLILGVAIWGEEPQAAQTDGALAMQDHPGALRSADEPQDPSERLNGFFSSSLDVFVDPIRTDDPGSGDRGVPVVVADPSQGGDDSGDRSPGQAGSAGLEDPGRRSVTVPEQPPAAPGGTDRSYVVVAGDSFARISRKVYGTERHTKAIMELNGISDEMALRPGQTLALPAVGGGEASAVVPQRGGASPVGGRTYTVKKGDSPAWISSQVFGTERYAQAIMDLNGISDARRLREGAVLRLPEADPVSPTVETAGAGHRTYTVRAGDSPALISRKMFGTESQSRAIMELNGIVDARRLRVGQVLQIPAAPRDGE